VTEYLKLPSGAMAARTAGYSPNRDRQQAYDNFRQPKIRRLVERALHLQYQGGRINTRSATQRDIYESTGRLFTCGFLGALPPDPWDLALWARGRIRRKGDVV
jgi:hypothetical protein